MKALALNATLKSTTVAEASSTDRMINLIAGELHKYGISTDTVRLVDLDIKAGVSADEGPGDAWPDVRRKILEAEILIVGTPIWLGQPSSVCKRVLERMDAFLAETDSSGRMPTFGRVAIVAVVGNEDGAHRVSADLYQSLNDVGFTLASNAVAYWVGEAMQSTNFVELPSVPEKVKGMISVVARNTAHLAGLLKRSPYPG